MANRCDLCSKGKKFGLSHRHHRGVAGGQWKKRAQKTNKSFLPNIHSLKAEIGGVKSVWKLCTKCQRLIKEEIKNSVAKEAEKKSSASVKKTENSKKAIKPSAIAKP